MLTATAVSAVPVPETAYGRITNIEPEILLVEDSSSRGTEEIVRSYFRDIPILVEIARCESTFVHNLPNGQVLQGRVDSADTGVMQINRRYHEARASAMQLNLNDIYHNMAYARYLYETQGTQPWSASMPCWSKSLALN